MTWRPVSMISRVPAAVQMSITKGYKGFSVKFSFGQDVNAALKWRAGTVLGLEIGEGEHAGCVRISPTKGGRVLRDSWPTPGLSSHVMFPLWPGLPDKKLQPARLVAWEVDGSSLIVHLPAWAVASDEHGYPFRQHRTIAEIDKSEIRRGPAEAGLAHGKTGHAPAAPKPPPNMGAAPSPAKQAPRTTTVQPIVLRQIEIIGNVQTAVNWLLGRGFFIDKKKDEVGVWRYKDKDVTGRDLLAIANRERSLHDLPIFQMRAAASGYPTGEESRQGRPRSILGNEVMQLLGEGKTTLAIMERTGATKNFVTSTRRRLVEQGKLQRAPGRPVHGGSEPS